MRPNFVGNTQDTKPVLKQSVFQRVFELKALRARCKLNRNKKIIRHAGKRRGSGKTT